MSPVLAEQLVSELVYVHVGMAIISYATFTVSFIFFYYVFIAISPIKKRKKWNARLRRLGNLPKLESMSYGLNLFSVPFFLTSNFIRMYMGIYKIG